MPIHLLFFSWREPVSLRLHFGLCHLTCTETYSKYTSFLSLNRPLQAVPPTNQSVIQLA